MTLPFGPPLKPMLAKGKEDVPTGEDWVYEPKWDGFRTIVYRDGDDLWLRSRNDRPLNRYFPEIERTLLEGLPERCIIDGEIILPTSKGLDFDALQLRLHPAASRVERLSEETPASFVAFDLLALDGNDLRGEPLSARTESLDRSLDAARPKTASEPAVTIGPCLYLCPRTDDPRLAEEWFDELERVHLDGIVAKRTSLPYAPGERVMIKVKHRRTADCVVGGYRRYKHGGVGSLLLGLYDNGVLHYVGHTSSFNASVRKELQEMLEPLRSEKSFGGDVELYGPGGGSRWSTGRELEWVSIEPVLVCEVSYDFVQSEARFRHAARFLRWRDDKRPEECTFDQVKT